MDVDGMVTFLIMFGFPIFFMWRGYLKMSEEEQQEAMSDFKSFRFLSTIGLIAFGFFLGSLGKLIGWSPLLMLGIALTVIGGIIAAAGEWKQAKNHRPFVVLFLIGVAVWSLTI